jgi:hypothetical protein
LAFPAQRCRPPVSKQRSSFLVELPSPEPASSRFILPWPFLLLRVPSLKSPAQSSFDVGKPTQGLVPHRGITGARPLIRERCQALASFRPQVFSTSRRFPPPTGCSGLFHPAATSRVVAVQGLLSPRSRPLFESRVRSPLPLSFVRSPSLARWYRFWRTTKIAGCHAFEGLDFEALIRARARCVRVGG